MLPPFSVDGAEHLFVCCLFDYLGIPVELNQQQSGTRDSFLDGQRSNLKGRSSDFQETNETLITFPHVCYIGDINETNKTIPVGDDDWQGTSSVDIFLSQDGELKLGNECFNDCNETAHIQVNCSIAPESPTFVTSVEEKVLVWLPRIFGPVSLLCSLWILCYVARDKRRRKNSYHRIVWAMSLVNFCSTIWLSFSKLPTPSVYGGYGARGNQSTCDAQGWFIQFSIGAPLYHASLSLYYYLRLCRQWSERDIRKHAEPFIHIGVMGFSFLSATVPIPLQLYNPALWCWIYELPYGCDSSDTCLRGYRAFAFQWGLFYGPLWGVIAWVTVMLILIYCYVRRQENKTAKYTYNNNNTHMNRLSTNPTPKRKKKKKRSHARAVASNAAFYVSSFFIVWLAPTLCDMVFDQAHVAPVWLYIISVSALSLQGFFNFAVYIRPKFMQQVRKHFKTYSSERHSSTTTEESSKNSWAARLRSASIQIRSTVMGFWNSVFSNPDSRENQDDWKLGTPDAEPSTQFGTSVSRGGPAVSGLTSTAAVAHTTSIAASLPIQASLSPQSTDNRNTNLTHPT